MVNRVRWRPRKVAGLVDGRVKEALATASGREVLPLLGLDTGSWGEGLDW